MSVVPVPRLCVVEKPSAECEYGFNLHAERGKGQFVGAVDIGSPADLSGLRPGDHIIAVNGEPISDLSHREVVHRIKSNSMRCSLLVLDEESVQWFKEHGVPLSEPFSALRAKLKNGAGRPPVEDGHQSNEESGSCSIALPPSGSDASVAEPATPVPTPQMAVVTASFAAADQSSPSSNSFSPPPISVLPSISPAAIPRHHRTQIETAPAAATPAQLQAAGPKPRLCTLLKKSPAEEFGFNLHAERGKGHFVGAVDKGGIADGAGLETGQRIVGVNGRLVSAQTPHKEIVKLIKNDPLSTVLLVASEEVDRFYADHGLSFSYDHSLVFAQPKGGVQSRTNSNACKMGPTQRLPNMCKLNDALKGGKGNGTTTEQHQQQPQQRNGAAQPRGAMALSSRPPTPTSTYTATPPPVVAVQIKVHSDNRTDIQIKEVDQQQQQRFAQHSPAAADLSASAEDDDVQKTLGKNEWEKRPNGKHVLSGLSPEPLTPPTYHKTNLPSQQNSPEEQKGTFHDIFALSAQEARQQMRGRKRDPRKEAQMTLEEKHRLILNL